MLNEAEYEKLHVDKMQYEKQDTTDLKIQCIKWVDTMGYSSVSG